MGKEKSGSSLSSGFWQRLPPPKTFDRQTKKWVERTKNGPDHVEHMHNGTQMWFDSTIASYEMSLLGLSRRHAAAEEEPATAGGDGNRAKTPRTIVMNRAGDTMDVDIVVVTPRRQRRVHCKKMTVASALEGTPKSISESSLIWQRKAGEQRAMFAGQYAVKPQALARSGVSASMTGDAEWNPAASLRRGGAFKSIQSASIPPKAETNTKRFNCKSLLKVRDSFWDHLTPQD